MMIRGMMKSLAFAIFFGAALTGNVRAEEGAVKKYVLDNGLTVLINEMPASPMTAVYAWVKTGSANEGKFAGSGITHFVEHMLFKGTERRGVGVISDEAKAIGGAINASTSHDFTVFTLSVPRERFVPGLDLVADMVQHAVFDPQEVERERSVIQKEMKMVNDRPDHKLQEALSQAVYMIHPYRHPIIGYDQMFRAITREQLYEYYKTYYAPNNMILSIAGGVKARDVLPEVKKVFEVFQAQSTPVRNLPQEPRHITPRRVVFGYPTDLTRMVIAYQGMPLLDRDLFAADVLAMALGSGVSSRLNQKLYEEKHMVEAIDAANDTPLDRGNFEVRCLLRKDDTDAVIEAVQAIIDDVKRNGLRRDELDKVKRRVMAQNIYERQTAEGVAYRAAMEEAFTGDARFSDQYMEGVRSVTNDDVKQAARKYLLAEARSVVVMKPAAPGEPAKDPANDIQRDPEPQMFTLSNGLKVILKKDPSLPLVSFQVLLKGGLREEPLDKPGLAELTGRVWGRGVKGKTYARLAHEIEGRAGSYSTRAGMDSLALSMDVLSEDIPQALDDLGLLLRFPVFPEAEIRKEKENMLTEMLQRKDSIAQATFRVLNETLFDRHPFRRDPLGTAASLAKIAPKDVTDFYRQHLSANGMTLAVYGNIDPDRLKQDLTHRFADLPVLIRPLTLVSEDPLKGQRVKAISMDKEQAFVAYGFHGPKISDDRRYALSVAVNALSSSLGGRMFRRIRDELGKAYALSGFCSPGMDVGLCSFYVMTTTENVDKVRSLLEEELQNCANKGFTEKEIADARTALKSGFARDHQSVSSQVARDLSSEFYGVGYRAYQKYNERIDAVTPAAAQNAVKVFLEVTRSAVVVARPSR
jgi:zinc protease